MRLFGWRLRIWKQRDQAGRVVSINFDFRPAPSTSKEDE